MSSFGSSFVNKSNKKFAPKAPAQRKRPATQPPPPTPDASAVTQEPSATLQTSARDTCATSLQIGKASLPTPLDEQNVPAQNYEGSTDSPIHDEESERPSKRRRTDDASILRIVDEEAVTQQLSPPSTSAATPETRSLPTDRILDKPASADTANGLQAAIVSDTPVIHNNEAAHAPVDEQTAISARSALATEAASGQTEVDSRDMHVGGSASIRGADEEQGPQGNVQEDSQHEERWTSREEPTQPQVGASATTAIPTHLGLHTTVSEYQPIATTVPAAPQEERIESVEETLRDILTREAAAAAPLPIPISTPNEPANAQASSGSQGGASVCQTAVTPVTKKPRKPRKKATPVQSANREPSVDGNGQEAPNPPVKKPRQPRERAAPASNTDGGSQLDATGQEEPTSTAKKPRKPRKQQQAAAPVARMTIDGSAPDSTSEPHVDGTPAPELSTWRGGRKRAVTPDGAEDAQIDPETVTMFDLCKDTRQGKKSQREAEFQSIDWTEVVRRRKQAEARARAGEVDEENQNREAREQEQETQARQRAVPRGPQLKIVNGRAVLDTESLVVNNIAGPGAGDEAAVEESDLTKRINSQSWLYDNRRNPEDRYRSSAKSDPWSEEQTDQFYEALRMFGTDFFIISKMFPGKTRRHIKLKFNREERSDPPRVKLALIGESIPMDLAVYCAATGQEADEFKDPEALEEELRAQDEAQKQEIEQQKEEQAEAARKKQEAAKARAEGKKMKKVQGKKGNKGAVEADGDDQEGLVDET